MSKVWVFHNLLWNFCFRECEGPLRRVDNATTRTTRTNREWVFVHCHSRPHRELSTSAIVHFCNCPLSVPPSFEEAFIGPHIAQAYVYWAGPLAPSYNVHPPSPSRRIAKRRKVEKMVESPAQ